MRLKLTLAYDGSAYHGWQLQAKANPPPTVQGAVETALFTLLRVPVRVFGAGRTDAGVHALGQVCHCDVQDRAWDWRERLNAVLPADIRVIASEAVSHSFHARKDALAKTYIYQFWLESAYVNPLLRNQVWQVGPLDSALICAGLERFLGEHDFASFRNSGTDTRTTARTINAISLARPTETSDLPMLRLQISGDGFLKQMVRNIAGFLATIGRRKLAWQDLGPILAARSRTALPSITAPAHGLILASINYGA